MGIALLHVHSKWAIILRAQPLSTLPIFLISIPFLINPFLYFTTIQYWMIRNSQSEVSGCFPFPQENIWHNAKNLILIQNDFLSKKPNPRNYRGCPGLFIHLQRPWTHKEHSEPGNQNSVIQRINHLVEFHLEVKSFCTTRRILSLQEFVTEI